MAESLEIRVRQENGITVIETKGYINNEGGEKVVSTCDALIAEGRENFILQLEQCTIVNSVGISFLIEVIEKIEHTGGRVAFCCVSSTIAKTFRIMGLLQSAAIYETEGEARRILDG